jgi:hypothetical protein
LVISALLLSGSLAVGTVQAQTPVQSFFVGDRDCGDDPGTWCAFTVVPEHRYLHVVLHDLAGNDDWRVQVAPACRETMLDAAGGVPIAASGYLEVVVDLAEYGVVAFPSSLCFVLRGRSHWWVTYYTAYLDDTAGPDADRVYPGYIDLGGRPALPDLDVEYIHIAPTFAYDARPNVPTEGQRVIFTAFVANAGGEPALPFTYWWTLDGRQFKMSSFRHVLAAGQQTTLTLTWPWDTTPHDLRLQLSPTGAETSSENDGLTIRTTALRLGIWIERSAYDYFQQNQWEYCRSWSCAGSNSFADWLQRQVYAWNSLFASSVYPDIAPRGVTDRVRVDQITIVPDGTLPLHGGQATDMPDALDHSVDLEWGLPAQGIEKTYRLRSDGAFDVDWGLLHELGHARSLADLYRFDIPLKCDFAFNFTGIDGRPVFDASQPFSPTNRIRTFSDRSGQPFLYENAESQDLMSCTCVHAYSAYDTLVLNRIRGRRAQCGNANPPCNLGDWFFDLPPINRIRIVNRDGSSPSNGSRIYSYFDQGPSYTAHDFDATHRESLAVQQGVIQLDRDPFRSGSDRWAAGHNLLLLDLPDGAAEDLCFIEPAILNLAYWQGYRTDAHPATYTLRLGAQIHNACNLQLPPALVNEPFATSPSTSTADIGSVREHGRKSVRALRVQLLDDASPPHAMTGRIIRVLDASGHQLGTTTTNSTGRASIQLAAGKTAVQIDDVTDNDLSLGARVPGRGAP